MKKYDCVALGELLIDFINTGESEQGNPVFEANPGGAPCNVLAMMCKMGKKAAFIGKVGDDQFGRNLRATLEECGIDSTGLISDGSVNTTLAFVHKKPDGDRDFTFYRNPGADMMLGEDEVKEDLLTATRIFHFGTLSMTNEGVRAATLKAVNTAKKSGAIISLDPNLRERLWDNLDRAKEMMWEAVGLCDFLKISDNEVQFLTGEEDYDKGIAVIRERSEATLICLTMGADGSRAYYKDMRVEVPGVRQENVVDTTGAGDTFCGTMLSFIAESGLDNLSENTLTKWLQTANKAASIVVTKKGAIKSMPDKSVL